MMSCSAMGGMMAGAAAIAAVIFVIVVLTIIALFRWLVDRNVQHRLSLRTEAYHTPKNEAGG